MLTVDLQTSTKVAQHNDCPNTGHQQEEQGDGGCNAFRTNIRNINSEHTKDSQRLVNIFELAISLLPNTEEFIHEIDACSKAPQDEAPHQPFILVPSCQVTLYEQEER